MPRRRLPLALTIAVHLLFACLYLAQRQPPPTMPTGPQSYMLVVIPQPVMAKTKPKPEPKPPIAPSRNERAQVHIPVHVAVAVPVDARAADETLAPVTAPPGLSARDLLAIAKRDVGKIDRELRAAGALPALAALSADSPHARFERAMAAAWIDRSNTMVVDRYTSGDGVVIERVTRRGGSTCYMSGTVNFVPGILHDSSKPQTVNCPPPGGGWVRK